MFKYTDLIFYIFAGFAPISEIEKGGPWPAWLSCLERWPLTKSWGSIPGQGTYLGCGFDAWSRCVRIEGNQLMLLSRFCVPLSL